MMWGNKMCRNKTKKKARVVEPSWSQVWSTQLCLWRAKCHNAACYICPWGYWLPRHGKNLCTHPAKLSPQWMHFSWDDSEPQIIYSLSLSPSLRVCVCVCVHVRVHLHMHARGCVTLQQGQTRLRGMEKPEVLVMWLNSWSSKRWRTKRGRRMEKKVTPSSSPSPHPLHPFVICSSEWGGGQCWTLIPPPPHTHTATTLERSAQLNSRICSVIFLTFFLHTAVLNLMMLSTDGDEGENSAGKKKKKKKKKKGCESSFSDGRSPDLNAHVFTL